MLGETGLHHQAGLLSSTSEPRPPAVSHQRWRRRRRPPRHEQQVVLTRLRRLPRHEQQVVLALLRRPEPCRHPLSFSLRRLRPSIRVSLARLLTLFIPPLVVLVLCACPWIATRAGPWLCRGVATSSKRRRSPALEPTTRLSRRHV